MRVPIPTKIEVKASPVHGLGVFAIETIEPNEVIEVCYAIFFKRNLGEHDDIFLKYRFAYPCGPNPTHYAIPLGYGCIYNHSDSNNAFWTCDSSSALYYFVSNRRIEVGEEICTSYGGPDYWKAIKSII